MKVEVGKRSRTSFGDSDNNQAAHLTKPIVRVAIVGRSHLSCPAALCYFVVEQLPGLAHLRLTTCGTAPSSCGSVPIIHPLSAPAKKDAGCREFLISTQPVALPCSGVAMTLSPAGSTCNQGLGNPSPSLMDHVHQGRAHTRRVVLLEGSVRTRPQRRHGVALGRQQPI